MSMALPTGARGRWLAVGVTLVLAVLVWTAAVAPLLAWRGELRQTVLDRGALARRMAALAETLPELRRQAGLAAANAPAAVTLLEGSTDSLAGAGLQARVRELAGRAEVSLTSAEALPAEAIGSYRRIGVRIAATGGWPALVELLRALEAASPRMLLDDLQLQAAPTVIGATARPVTMTVTVLAFRAGQANPA